MNRPTADPPATRRAGLVGVAVLVALGLGAASSIAGEIPGPGDGARRIARIEDYAPPEEFVVAGGIKTHYVKKGEAGPAIVLVHGFGSCTYTWRHNIDALAARGFRVYAVDVKGFGLTAKPLDGRYDLAAFADHLLAFLDALRLERPILVGNSMGGAIVARVALLHPDRASGVVLVAAAPQNFLARPAARADRAGPPGWPAPGTKADGAGMPGPPSAALSLKIRAALTRSLITRRAVENGLKAAYHDPKFVTAEGVEVHFRTLFIEGAAEALLALVDTTPGPAVEAAPPLSSLKPPALIVWGRHDRVLPVAQADMFARELPAARKVIFEDSGHMPHEEESAAFNALVAEFAATAASPPRSR